MLKRSIIVYMFEGFHTTNDELEKNQVDSVESDVLEAPPEGWKHGTH